MSTNYQTLVLNDGPFGNALAVSLFRHRARACAHAPMFLTAISKRDAVSQDESHVLYSRSTESLKTPRNFDVFEEKSKPSSIFFESSKTPCGSNF